MENLSLHDAGNAPAGPGGPPVVPQLPVRDLLAMRLNIRTNERQPQMFTTAAQLLDLTDSECANDGDHLHRYEDDDILARVQKS